MQRFSTRTHFIIAALLTVCLLIGSAVLQQIVFKADQELSALVLSPTTFRTTQGEFVDIDVQSGSGDTVFATGLQAELTFTEMALEFVEALPATGWRTLSIVPAAGTVRWVITPIATEATILELKGQATLGRLRFRALEPGVATVSFNQAATLLSAVDTVSGNFVYNAAATVQSTAGTVTPRDAGAATFPETDIATLTAPETLAAPLFGAQRIVSTFAATGSRDALVFATLGYPGRASVEFGETPQLGLEVESLGQTTHHVLPLSNLTPEKQYYYRVVGEETGVQSRVIGATRSFKLPSVSLTGVVSPSSSEVIAFPNRTDRLSSIYVFPRDEAGAAVVSSQITLPKADLVEVGVAKKQADYFHFELTGQLPKKEIVTLRPVANGDVTLAGASVVFDPEYETPTRLASAQEVVLAWNQKSMGLLLGGAILLFLLGILFVRLVRSR